MTRESDAFRHRISDERMLDWIDGMLSVSEERQLERECDAETVAFVKRARADRAEVRELGHLRAPADLHDRLMEAFERESLLDPSMDPIPISSFELSTSSARTRSSPAIPLALAAGMLLLVSGGAYLMLGGGHSSSAPQGMQYALNDDSTPAPAPIAEPETREADASPTNDNAAKVAADMQAIEASAPVKQEKIPMTEGRILRLAQEGRVVMRVVGEDMNSLERVKADGATPMYGRDWKLRDQVSDRLAKAVAPGGMPFGLNNAEEFAYASSDALGLIGPRAALNWPMAALVDRSSRVRATLIADVPMTESSLKAFRAVMSDRLDAKVVFEELKEPVEIPPSLDPVSTLWWTRGSSRWIERVSMPVVIEER